MLAGGVAGAATLNQDLPATLFQGSISPPTMQISHHHAQNVLVNGMPGTADNTMTPSGTAENGLLHSSESQDQFLINQKVQMLIKDAFGGNAAATTTLHRQVSGHEATLNEKFPTQNS